MRLALSNITIVIVEDHPELRTAIERFLQGKGAVVVASADACEGLQAVKQHHPDLVLSDISLPLRNGFELLKDIRTAESEAGTRVPVIAMTAFSVRFDSTRTIAAGFQAHLDKPFTSDQLMEAIRLVLKR